jgi:hypothetical protein
VSLLAPCLAGLACSNQPGLDAGSDNLGQGGFLLRMVLIAGGDSNNVSLASAELYQSSP